ncbi:MAG: phage tail sheath family protein [Bacteroidota bacterium]
MATYKTPGVFVEEISKFPPSVAAVETAIPAFIGYTKQAKVGAEDFHADSDNLIIRPIRITSLLEYETFFGNTEQEAAGAITVRIEDTTDGDPDNPTVVARKVSAINSAPSAHNLYYAMQAFYANGGGPCYIVSVGQIAAAGGNILPADLTSGLQAVAKEDEVTLINFPESGALSDSDYAGLMSAALDQCGLLQDRFAVMDLKLAPTSLSIRDDATTFRGLSLPLDNLKYGACYAPHVETIFNYLYDPAQVAVERSVDGADFATEGNMAAFNPDGGGTPDGVQYAQMQLVIDAIPLVLPSSPLVLGQYAKTDNTRGVWKAPANVALAGVVKPTLKITNAEQSGLNVDTSGKSINAIRSFAGKGTLVWGARTLAGNDNEWRYVPVRRFFNFAEESIKKATEAFVFEPNDANTWVKVRAMIENFLLLQWRAGALQGAKPEQAFYVRVALGETMTALDILEGRMIVEIGMAVVRPAEFIILRFSHKMAEA